MTQTRKMSFGAILYFIWRAIHMWGKTVSLLPRPGGWVWSQMWWPIHIRKPRFIFSQSLISSHYCACHPSIHPPTHPYTHLPSTLHTCHVCPGYSMLRSWAVQERCKEGWGKLAFWEKPALLGRKRNLWGFQRRNEPKAQGNPGHVIPDTQRQKLQEGAGSAGWHPESS